jgi:truncated hemoglobin YjbI
VTLYDELGGEPVLRAVLTDLYDQLFDDLMVGFLFAGSDKAHIIEQQVAFTGRFLGGPQVYAGKPLPEAHERLPLLPGHFDRRHHLLRKTLERHHVPEAVAAEWLRIDAQLKASVLKSGEDARQKARSPG